MWKVGSVLAAGLVAFLVGGCGAECARGWHYTLNSAVEKIGLSDVTEVSGVAGARCATGEADGHRVEVCEFDTEAAQTAYLSEHAAAKVEPLVFSTPFPMSAVTDHAKTSDRISSELFSGC